jgi:protoporphyrinogen oxidase
MRTFVESLLGGAWSTYTKRAIVDSAGIRTPFPFHANLHGRPLEVVVECLHGMWEASRLAHGPGPVTFADWIARVHGVGVAKYFMDPYNTKQWTVTPSEMGRDWMGDFIPTIDSARILEGALRPVSESIGPNASFHYAPRGAGTLADALAARVGTIRFQTSLVGVDACARTARLSDGSSIEYGAMISTIPLRTLGALLAPLPKPEYAAWERLEGVDLVLADVGFENPEPCDVHWCYFPDPDVLAYRLHVVHALSSQLMPPGHGLYCLEISHSRHRPLPDGDLRERVIADLVRTGWLRGPEQVSFYRERRFPCSYVIPRVGFRRDADTLRAYSRGFDIHSIGRFGAWKYCNQEDALVDGRQAAHLLLEEGVLAP